MKRELFDNVVVRVGATGIAVDRKGFLSAVVAADIGEITGSPTETKLSVKVEHSDTADGTYRRDQPKCGICGVCAGSGRPHRQSCIRRNDEKRWQGK